MEPERICILSQYSSISRKKGGGREREKEGGRERD